MEQLLFQHVDHLTFPLVRHGDSERLGFGHHVDPFVTGTGTTMLILAFDHSMDLLILAGHVEIEAAVDASNNAD